MCRSSRVWRWTRQQRRRSKKLMWSTSFSRSRGLCQTSLKCSHKSVRAVSPSCTVCEQRWFSSQTMNVSFLSLQILVTFRSVIPERPDVEQNFQARGEPLPAAHRAQNHPRCCPEPRASWKRVNNTFIVLQNIMSFCFCLLQFAVYRKQVAVIPSSVLGGVWLHLDLCWQLFEMLQQQVNQRELQHCLTTQLTVCSTWITC